MPRIEYHITVVDRWGTWKRTNILSMVNDAKVPVAVAARYEKVRREMSPSGLKQKLKAQTN